MNEIAIKLEPSEVSDALFHAAMDKLYRSSDSFRVGQWKLLKHETNKNGGTAERIVIVQRVEPVPVNDDGAP